MDEKRFTAKDKNDKEIELLVVKPPRKEMIESEKIYKREFRRAIEEDGAILRKKLNMHMTEQGIWNDDKEKEYNDLLKEINLLDYQINKGRDTDGEKLKLSKAKEMALELSDKRIAFRNLISERQELDHVTAEGQAETERFAYLTYVSTLNFLDRKRYCDSFEEFKFRGDEDAIVEASKYVGQLVFELDENHEDTLTENKFLKRFKFANEKNELINSDGERVDRNGQRVDGDGFLLNEDGKRININDLPILEENESVDTAEFFDDLNIEVKKVKKKATKKKEAVQTE